LKKIFVEMPGIRGTGTGRIHDGWVEAISVTFGQGGGRQRDEGSRVLNDLSFAKCGFRKF
jgi:hypothetical protein